MGGGGGGETCSSAPAAAPRRRRQWRPPPRLQTCRPRTRARRHGRTRPLSASSSTCCGQSGRRKGLAGGALSESGATQCAPTWIVQEATGDIHYYTGAAACSAAAKHRRCPAPYVQSAPGAMRRAVPEGGGVIAAAGASHGVRHSPVGGPPQGARLAVVSRQQPGACGVKRQHPDDVTEPRGRPQVQRRTAPARAKPFAGQINRALGKRTLRVRCGMADLPRQGVAIIVRLPAWGRHMTAAGMHMPFPWDPQLHAWRRQGHG